MSNHEFRLMHVGKVYAYNLSVEEFCKKHHPEIVV